MRRSNVACCVFIVLMRVAPYTRVVQHLDFLLCFLLECILMAVRDIFGPICSANVLPRSFLISTYKGTVDMIKPLVTERS